MEYYKKKNINKPNPKRGLIGSQWFSQNKSN